MSLYVDWLNQIKLKADGSWLTESQQQALSDLLKRWPAERIVCLCGHAGSGKSFLARILAQEHGFLYVSKLSETPESTERVVVDGEAYVRLMRATAQMLGVRKVVVVSRNPPQERIPAVELSLNERDVREFQRNLSQNHILQAFRTEVQGTDLGFILRNEAIERGADCGA
jgi:MoxR-like ATPase